MSTIARRLRPQLERHLARGKSVLLLGPRQTGKTTMLADVPADLRVSLVDPAARQRYERDPGLLAGEVAALPRRRGRVPRVVLDEVQKVPALLDAVQDLIDRRQGQFVLCGSSARKLGRGGANLLPGRVVSLRLDPLTFDELQRADLDTLLHYGSLPGIWTTPDAADRETDLASYVSGYLEEEVRAEALVRSIGSFGRFLELAALESGGIVSFRELSQQIGVSHTTIAGYYEVLEDCLVAERVDPLTRSRTRKRLTRSPRWLLFDLGVRRLAAREGTRPTPDRLGQLFEQLIGLELVRRARRDHPRTSVHFWRVPQGPEVDWVLARDGDLVPIEVKWTDAPDARQARHLRLFLDEYRSARQAFVVCRAPRRLRIEERIVALPWQDLAAVFT
jgi:predicted AAA+ superfamily ATPase